MTPVVLLLALAPLFWLSVVEFASRAPKRTWGAGLGALMAIGFLAGALAQLQELLVQRPSPHVMLAVAAFALLVGHAYALRGATFTGIVTGGFWVAGLAARLGGERWEEAYDVPERVLLVGLGAFIVGIALARQMPARVGPMWRVTGLIVALVTLLMLSFGVERPVTGLGPGAWQAATLVVAVAAMAAGAQGGWRETVYAGAAALLVLAVTKVGEWFGGELPDRWFAGLVGLVMLLVLLVTLRLRQGAGREAPAAGAERAPDDRRWLPAALVAVGAIVVVLVGSWWNRSGERREMVLTEREAELVEGEDGKGLVLVVNEPAPEAGNRVTVAKLAALGADSAGTLVPVELGGGGVRGYVVLELGGTVWRRHVEGVIREYVAVVVSPDTIPERQDSMLADFRRTQEERVSRLVVADAGTDGAALARDYPDGARHLILPAEFAIERRLRRGAGFVVDTAGEPVPALRIHGVRLPLGGPALRGVRAAAGVPVRYTARVATGRRFEPWVEGMEVLEARAPDSLRLH
jgi:hypothetical protein